MNKFAQHNLNKRIHAKANEFGLVGIEREVFVFIAQGGSEYGINSVRRKFSERYIPAVQSLASLMEKNLVFQMVSSCCYYTVAV
jgi:hypothetical protein